MSSVFFYGHDLRRPARRRLAHRRAAPENLLMRILFLTHAFNSLTQRLYTELTEAGHEVSIEFDITDSVTEEAVALFTRSDRRAVPQARVPDSDWPATAPSSFTRAFAAIAARRRWTGRSSRRGRVGRHRDAGERRDGRGRRLGVDDVPDARSAKAAFTATKSPKPPSPACWRPWSASASGRAAAARPCERRVRGRPWPSCGNRTAGSTGVDDTTAPSCARSARPTAPRRARRVAGGACYLHDAHRRVAARPAGPSSRTRRGDPAARRPTGPLLDGHDLKPRRRPYAVQAARPRARGTGSRECPSAPLPRRPRSSPARRGAHPLRRERAGSGPCTLRSTTARWAPRSVEALRRGVPHARSRPTRVIALMGGADFWSNGIHLNLIEASATRPTNRGGTSTRSTTSCARSSRPSAAHDRGDVQGNAGAGGAFLALAADRVFARDGVILNPHYKSMGNLYGSEYWTYLLPRRVSPGMSPRLVDRRLPISARRPR